LQRITHELSALIAAQVDIQPQRVNAADRVLIDVGVGINSGGKPDRIALDIAADLRVIVSVKVLREPRLRLVVLAWEAQVVGDYLSPFLNPSPSRM
jgi:hypothetical protein